MKWLRLLVVGGLIGIGASAFAKVSLANSNTCTVPYRHDATVKVGDNSINAEVAKDTAQQETGLGGRTCIGAEQGMLFAFSKPGQYDFWMKDMKFPIDIVWINENKMVVDVTPQIAPNTYPKTFTSSKPAEYILELGAGRAQQLNITEGTILQFSL
jgi:uncharacterized membrane protein (UPF0127 family)